MPTPPPPRRLAPLLLLPLLLLCGRGDGGAAATQLRAEPRRLPDSCRRFSALWDTGPTADDLSYWRSVGVTEAMALQGANLHASLPNHTRNALLYGFHRGRALVLPVNLSSMATHGLLQLPHIKMMLHLEEEYGAEYLPDVDFVLTTEDVAPITRRPVTAKERRRVVAPQFRYGKSNWSTDLLFPNFHFGLKRYDTDLLDQSYDIDARHPWSSKLPVAFGRFSSYYRVLPSRYSPPRLGAGGESLCQRSTCSVRQHFAEWAARYSPAATSPLGAGWAAAAAPPPPPGSRAWSIDVRLHGRVPLADHAAYKYLMHLDGVALSSRLEQLLALGSLVFKEESGYFAFYHHLLLPGTHYLPFWPAGTTPEDLPPKLDWAAAHDEEAHRIALAGQALAKQYLQREARHCYVLWLLQGYSRALRYAPPLAPWAAAMVPLRELVAEQLLAGDGQAAGVGWAATLVREYKATDC